MTTIVDLLERSIRLCDQGNYEASVILLSEGLKNIEHDCLDESAILLGCDLAIQCETFGHYDVGTTHVKALLDHFPQNLSLLWHMAKLLLLSEKLEEASIAIDEYSACIEELTIQDKEVNAALLESLRDELRRRQSGVLDIDGKKKASDDQN